MYCSIGRFARKDDSQYALSRPIQPFSAEGCDFIDEQSTRLLSMSASVCKGRKSREGNSLCRYRPVVVCRICRICRIRLDGEETDGNILPCRTAAGKPEDGKGEGIHSTMLMRKASSPFQSRMQFPCKTQGAMGRLACARQTDGKQAGKSHKARSFRKLRAYSLITKLTPLEQRSQFSA